MKQKKAPSDITGLRFGTLVAISEHPIRNKHGQKQYVCKCDCGTTSIILRHSLVQGTSTRCNDHPKNEFIEGETYSLINVSTPKQPNTFAKVSNCDLDKLINYRNVNGRMKWCAHDAHDGKWGMYVIGTDMKTRMHRVILDVTDPQLIVDHINGDTLDNRRENVRVITRSENNKNMRMRVDNTSGCAGVKYLQTRDVYQARIQLQGKVLHIGVFNTLRDATIAYKAASKALGFSNRHGLKVVDADPR